MSESEEVDLLAGVLWDSPQAIVEGLEGKFVILSPADKDRLQRLAASQVDGKLILEHARTQGAARIVPSDNSLDGIEWEDPQAVETWAKNISPASTFRTFKVPVADQDRLNDYRKANGENWDPLLSTIADHARAQTTRQTMTFDAPHKVLEWTGGSSGWAHYGLSQADMARIRPYWAAVTGASEEKRTVIAHLAREQIARETKTSTPALTATPAMTLEQAREVAKAHGFLLTHESGYEKPEQVLVLVEAQLELFDANVRRDAAFNNLSTKDRQKAPFLASSSYAQIEAEAKRLRAFPGMCQKAVGDQEFIASLEALAQGK